jgi:serine/threonine protein kinase
MKSILQAVGEYQILEKLGRGGMADVYLALDSKNNRRVALKLVECSPGEEAQEIVAAEKLGAELQAQLCLIESRVPKINSFGEREGFFCIDMEYVEGRDLSEVIRAGALQPQAAARIAVEICSVLCNAHRISLRVDGREFRAIVHGDIKPKNIRLDPKENVRILDFGIAKGLSLTRRLTSNRFGSAAYSSPERLETGRIDEMSDLWSVGVVLYEMIAGRTPFEAPSTDRLESVVRSHTPPQPLDHDCPVEIQQIIFKALAPNPGRRYQTAEQFESDLRAFIAGEPTLAQQESEETRRTGREESEETRRTDPMAPAASGRAVHVDGPSASPPSPSQAGQGARRSRHSNLWLGRSLRLSMIALPVLAVLLGIRESVAYRAALSLKPAFAAGQIDGDRAWQEYEEVRKHSLFGIATLPLRSPLAALLHRSCDRIVDDYRNSDFPKVREGDWIRCKRYMTYAAELDRTDRKASAMLEYAGGHVLRINRKDLEAVAAFQRAASLDPRWPDPYLGLGRTYIYNLKDVERGTQALKRAQDLGYSFGRREKGMMADAYSTRAVQYWDGATRLRDSEQEKELLKKAREDSQQALELYSEIAPWGDSTHQIRTVQDTLRRVEERLRIVDPPNPLFPWNWFKN